MTVINLRGLSQSKWFYSGIVNWTRVVPTTWWHGEPPPYHLAPCWSALVPLEALEPVLLAEYSPISLGTEDVDEPSGLTGLTYLRKQAVGMGKMQQMETIERKVMVEPRSGSCSRRSSPAGSTGAPRSCGPGEGGDGRAMLSPGGAVVSGVAGR